MGFDLKQLRRFKPPSLFCEKCYAFYSGTSGFEDVIENDEWVGARCSTCGVVYVSGDFEPWSLDEYLEHKSCRIKFQNLMNHANHLASIALIYENEKNGSRYPPIRCLFEALSAAQSFVHFVSYGISHIMIGASKLAAIRVPVRGIVSGTDFREDVIAELTEYPMESPKLKVEVFTGDFLAAKPHQKLVIVDGMIAFKGSANLTLSGWRNAAQGLEMIEVITDLDEIRNLNNRFFSPLWASRSNYGDQIVMKKEMF